MEQPKIQLRKIRDLGENLTDTFQFIKQELKPLLSSFIFLAGVFIITNGILVGVYESNISKVFDVLLQRNRAYMPEQTPETIFTPTYFLILFFSMFNLTAMCVAIASYLRAYNEKGSSPAFEEVWNIFKRKVIPIFFYNIIIWIVIVIGTCFCIAPGVYFMVVLAPFEIVVVMEDCSFGDAFGRCFVLIKNNFWLSFGIYIISSLIYYFSSAIVDVIFGLISGVISYLTTKSIHSTVGIVTGIISVLGYVFFIIFYISLSLNYFSLVEKVDGTGILNRLQTIGSDTNTNENIEEQY